MSGSDYKSSGVDIQAADDWVSRIGAQLGASGPAEVRARLRSGVGDYAAVFAASDAQWIALSCDGVGTKVLWAEQGLGSSMGIAQDLVGMNANDLLCVGARPTLFLDYIAVGSTALLKVGGPLDGFIRGLAHACHESGMIVVGGETAQMPDIYGERGYDLAGFALGFLEPREQLGVDRIQVGAELWGWASDGPHSNGFSWLRKLFDAKKDAEFIRRELMRPTHLYAKQFLGLRAKLREQGLEAGLQAAFHLTGSGVLNLIRAQPKDGREIGFDLATWPDPAGLPWLHECARRSEGGMASLWTTFNMGYGFAVVLSPEVTQKVGSLLNSSGLTRLGHVIGEPVVRGGGLEFR